MKIAFSPCPNDTFVFHALVHGLIPGAPELDVTYADIDITNRLATEADGPDILKISSAALPWVLSDYALLPSGGAMGRGCGPLLLTADKSEETDLAGKRVAVPSERSTAYLLFRLWAARNFPGGVNIEVVPFDKIMPAVRDRQFDAGLVIHAARFTYPSYGLQQLVDLGEWWEADTGLPIPLGSIIARRTLDVEKIADWIRASVEYAWAHPDASREYVMHHAQEMDPEVARQRIQLYVNDFTANLGDEGYNAIHYLLDRAAREGLVSEVSPELFR